MVLLNLDDDKAADIVLEWGDLAGSHGKRATDAAVRDLWAKRDVDGFDAHQNYAATSVPPHGSVFLKVVAKS